MKPIIRDGKYYIQYLDGEIEISEEELRKRIESFEQIEMYLRELMNDYNLEGISIKESSEIERAFRIKKQYEAFEKALVKIIDEAPIKEQAFTSIKLILGTLVDKTKIDTLDKYSKRQKLDKLILGHLKSLYKMICRIEKFYIKKNKELSDSTQIKPVMNKDHFGFYIQEIEKHPSFIKHLNPTEYETEVFLAFIDEEIDKMRFQANNLEIANPGMKYGVDFSFENLECLMKVRQVVLEYKNNNFGNTQKIKVINSNLKMKQIALIHIYEGEPITRENAKEIAAKYQYTAKNSGEGLFQDFTYFHSPTNRTGIPKDCTAKKLKNKIELFESILEHLNDNAKKRAIDEIEILKTRFENDYQ